MKSIIWGCCGSLPAPTPSSTIRRKVKEALWAAREHTFDNETELDAFLDTQPHSTCGTYKGNTSCVQIAHPGKEVIICDAGTGIRDLALSLDPLKPTIYHIFISHLHWDHIQGFPFFMPAYQAGNRIVFHGFHQETEKAIRDQMSAPCFPVPFESMKATIEFDICKDGAEFDVEDVHIRTIKQQHPGDSWGYRFERGGKTIVYSSDSEHGPEAQKADYPFINFFDGADILIFDGQYTFEQVKNEKRHWGHSDHFTAVELAARAKVKQLAVFHHEPAHKDRRIEEMYDDAIKHADSLSEELYPNADKRYPQKIVLAYDGLVLEV